MCAVCRICAFLRTRYGCCKADPAMLGLAVAFRSMQDNGLAEEDERRTDIRKECSALRSEVDDLKAYRREADMRLMRHGIELPDGPLP